MVQEGGRCIQLWVQETEGGRRTQGVTLEEMLGLPSLHPYPLPPSQAPVRQGRPRWHWTLGGLALADGTRHCSDQGLAQLQRQNRPVKGKWTRTTEPKA